MFSGVVVASRRVRAISKRHCMRGVVVERARGGTIVEDSIEALEIERKRLLNALEHLERSCEALREVEEEDKNTPTRCGRTRASRRRFEGKCTN